MLAVAACGIPAARGPADPATVVWDYQVRAVGAPVESLEVDVRLQPGSGDELGIDDDALPFVRDVQVASGSSWSTVEPRGSTWTAPCHAVGCRVRYRFALREAATKLDDVENAVASGDVITAPPSTWLLHPAAPQPGRFRFQVDTPPGVRFVAATHPSPVAHGTFEAPTDTLESTSFAVFGDFHTSVVTRGSARVDIAIAPHGMALTDAEVTAWVERAVDAIAAYYGRFAVDRTLVVVQAGKAGSPARGVTVGDGGPGLLVRTPGAATPEALRDAIRDDWVMTHELLHVTLPSLSQDHVWLSEGIPSYVEPFARARVGQVTAAKVWRDLLDGLPQGLPEVGDEGLEKTHTWGRTYWGGALFCLVADVTVREKTAGARSLDDALRAIVATGADVEAHWDIAQVLDVGDRATGTTVLHDLYARLAVAPGTVDLPALWARLGIRPDGTGVAFDEGAPLASIRRAMTTVQAIPR
jgi:hypothetical protein